MSAAAKARGRKWAKIKVGLLQPPMMPALGKLAQDYVLNPYLMSNGVAVPALLVLFGLLAARSWPASPAFFSRPRCSRRH
ncbi:MAG TPA: hypothetical protein VII31_08875 [Caldimonas sp.]|jgi:hypothetical protein